MARMAALKDSELKALLTVARAHNERHWLLLLLAYHHGLRVSEVIGLTKANFKTGFLTVQRLKGSNRTTQALVSHSDALLDEKMALEALLATIGPKDRLFDITRFGVNYIVKRYGAEAHIPEHKLHVHVLKHTCAMVAIKGGIEKARVRLGHKSIASTGEYLKVSDQEADRAYAAAVGATV